MRFDYVGSVLRMVDTVPVVIGKLGLVATIIN